MIQEVLGHQLFYQLNLVLILFFTKLLHHQVVFVLHLLVDIGVVVKIHLNSGMRIIEYGLVKREMEFRGKNLFIRSSRGTTP